MKSIGIALAGFIFLSLFTPYFFKQLPFLSLPCLGILIILLLRRDFQEVTHAGES